MKVLKVSAIREGTVIDHIPAAHTFKVADILKIAEVDQVVSVASNLDSTKMAKKGIIKVGSLTLSEREVQKIALLAPDATVNIVKDYQVVEKRKLSVPEELENVIRCTNPRCITNHEAVLTRFSLESRDPLQLRCHFCERVVGKMDVVLI